MGGPEQVLVQVLPPCADASDAANVTTPAKLEAKIASIKKTRIKDSPFGAFGKAVAPVTVV